jgi:DNA-binding XRE family transcriptional regulator
MSTSHTRPPAQPPLDELVRVRQARYPHLSQQAFAKRLGITRLHLIAVERGRRRPSVELALRWLALLPEARLSMFGDLPLVEGRIRALKKLQKVSPETFKAA